MNKRLLAIMALCATVTCGATAIASLRQTQVRVSTNGRNTDVVADTLEQLKSENWSVRSEAFYQLIQIGLRAEWQGQTTQIPTALSRLFREHPEESEQLKTTLIEILATENSLIASPASQDATAGEPLNEDFFNYHGDLIAAVAALKDKRSVRGLLGSISSGNMATEGLAQLGPDALDAVIEKLNAEEPDIKQSATIVLTQMLEPDNLQRVNTPASRQKIKLALMKSAQDSSPDARISAVEGLARLAKLGDADVVPLIRRLASGDNYHTTRDGRPEGFYPVREAARRALKSMEENRDVR